MNSELFEKMPPTKLFFRCAVPAVITSVFGALYSIVDGLFVGRFIGEDALAAINLVMPVIMIIEALANMIATGASVNISILLGEHKRDEASKVFSFSVKFIILFSTVIAAAGFIFAEPFVKLLAPGAGKEAVDYAVQYFRVCELFGPLIPVYFATDNYLRVCGREKTSMIITVSTQLLNVVLDYLLIVVFGQGVRAVAFSSGLSMAAGSLITLYMFTGRKADLYYTKENIPAKQFLHIVANGASEFFSTIAFSITSMIQNLFLLKYGGTTAVAAFSIVMYVDSVVGMLSFGLCDSLQPAISYCYGAGLTVRVKAIFKRVLTAECVCAAAAFAFMYFLGPSVAQIFIQPGDEELREVSIRAVKLFSWSYLVGWADMCFSSFLTALDSPVRSMIAAIFGALVFPVIFLTMLTSVLGLDGVWMTASAAGLASAVLSVALVLNLGRSLKKDCKTA